MKSRAWVFRRMTVWVAASALASAFLLIEFGSPAVHAGTTTSTPAWRQAITALPVPSQGCFTATYPALQWRSVACAKVHPKVPQQFAGAEPRQVKARGRAQQVGGCNDNSCDFAALTAAPMTGADGTFPGVTCASSPCESGPFENAGPALPNVYSLQLNTNFNLPAATSCSTAAVPADCTGWQQFVYDSHLDEIQVEPALIGYDKTCVAPFNAPDGAGNCYDENESATSVPALTPQQLMSDSVKFSGNVSVVAGKLTDTVTLIVSGTAYKATAADSLVNLSGSWSTAQFGLYGDRGAGEANFVAGSDMKVNLATHSGTRAAPTCIAFNSTGESNNLSLQPAPTLSTGPSPSLESDQNSISPPSPAGCATANGYGEIHLNTFGCASCTTHLSYNFQAVGDYQLADAPGLGGPAFDVQARLVPFAANPNLSVSQDIAAQVGSSQVAVCNAQPLQLEINKKPVQLASGGRVALPGGGSVSNQAGTYVIRDGQGDSAQAQQGSFMGVSYLNTWAGLGRWPTTVSGLLASAPGTANGVESQSGTVLTAPFQFSQFYPEYGDSWRVTPSQDMLSPCGTQFTSSNPALNYEASNLPTSEYQAAHSTCVNAGVQVPALLDACTLDVAVLGSQAVIIYRTLPTNITWGMITGGSSGVIRRLRI